MQQETEDQNYGMYVAGAAGPGRRALWQRRHGHLQAGAGARAAETAGGAPPVPGSTVGLRAVKAVTLRDRSPGPVGVGAVVPGGPQPVCPLCQGSLLMSSVQHSGKRSSGAGGLGSKQSPPDLRGERRPLRAPPEDSRSGAQGSAPRCPVSTRGPRLL